jgi:peptide deformylase
MLHDRVMLELQMYPSDILLREAEPVTVFDHSLVELCDAMVAFMYDKQGIGLAAPQVNVSKRIFVMRHGLTNLIAVNPKVVAHGEIVPHIEGCLSLPTLYEQVCRPRIATLTYQTLDGVLNAVELQDVEAFCAQHELDHLSGKMFFDRIPRNPRRALLRQWGKKRKIYVKK